MAIYIAIRKVREDAESAEFEFGPEEPLQGKMRLDKRSGAVTILTPLQGDNEGRASGRAVRKIKQHWEKGEVPNETCWAS